MPAKSSSTNAEPTEAQRTAIFSEALASTPIPRRDLAAYLCAAIVRIATYTKAHLAVELSLSYQALQFFVVATPGRSRAPVRVKR
jgi:hypothetical protein